MASKRAFKEVVWKISNIQKCLLTNEESKEAITSESFSIFIGDNFTKWKLLFYPCYGEYNDVGLFLKLVDQSLNFISDVRISCIKRTGKEFADSKSSNRGYKSFIKRETFHENFEEFVVDGRLTVVCSIVISPTSDNDKTIEKTAEAHKLVKFTSTLLLCEQFSDFEIQVGDNETEDFKCHKLVLASKSPVFAAMFNNNLTESLEGKCKVPDFDPATIKEMLRFIYCEKVDDLDRIARKLIYAAEKYELDELKKICIENIIENLNEDNVVEAMLMSHEISGAGSLFQECMTVVMRNYQVIREQQEFKELPNDILLKISDSLMEAIPSHI